MATATRMAVTAARTDLSECINRVTYTGARVVLQRHHKDAAAIVSMGDLKVLELVEDLLDGQAALDVLAASPGSIPWNEAKKQLRK
ncbi:MAG: type II toxin-antitoxin system Phd/YefM family antitoxin [Planctomycetes bacterium]|nr:type II toxin-antitoxin system Phd/YefM family antitoxin [Planctomycetota bacterium]